MDHALAFAAATASDLTDAQLQTALTQASAYCRDTYVDGLRHLYIECADRLRAEAARRRG